MTSVDGLLRSFEALRANLALEIAKSISVPSPTDGPPPEGYGAGNRSSQSIAQSLAGLKPPTTSPDAADQATIQALLKNIVTTNPMTIQAFVSSAMMAAAAQAQDTLPGDAAAKQALTKQDATQLAATSLPVDRLKGGIMPPLEQVAGAQSRAELLEQKNQNGLLERQAAAQQAQESQRLSAQPSPQQTALQSVERNEQGASLLKQEAANALQNAMHPSGLLQAAQTGIIPSFIMNAAMLPGWPIPNPAAMANFAAKTKISEEEMLKQLANMGASSQLIEKMKKKKPRVGKKLLIYLAMLLTAVETVVNTVADELAHLTGEEKNLKETREKANPHGRAGSRQHVYIE